MHPDADAMRASRIVYELDGMARTHVRKDLPYKPDGDDTLRADVYSPPGAPPSEHLPALIFISGDAAPAIMRDLKDSGQYVSWGQLAAAAGFVGVTFDHRSSERFTKLADPESDVRDLLAYVAANAPTLGIDPHRVGVWIASGGPPFGLRAVWASDAPRVRCVAVYYGLLNLEHLAAPSDPPEVVDRLREYSPARYLMRDPRPWPPLLLARAGQDRPLINESIDLFVAEALARNAPIELHNHPEGQHAFDLLNPDDRSRAIIQRTLDFFANHLT